MRGALIISRITKLHTCNDNNKMPYVRMSEYDVMYPTVSRLMCLWESFTIDDDAGMLTPITVYLENIPGAITSVRKLVDRWDSVSKSTGDGGSFSSFKEGGISIYKNRVQQRIHIT